jgi:pyruvate formate lyase activating enzyme
MEVIRLDQPYYERSGGGVTLSGGEPTAQPEFSQAILQACNSHGIDTAIETSGACEWNSLARLLPSTDLVFFDLKHINSDLHMKHTGKTNDQILVNLKHLVNHHHNVVVRVPLIPGFSDDDEYLRLLAAYLSSLDQKLELELIPYHRLGVSKYQQLGRKYSMNDAAAVEKEALIDREGFLQSLGMRIF